VDWLGIRLVPVIKMNEHIRENEKIQKHIANQDQDEQQQILPL
jgi:hypothetical protein